MPAPDTMVVRGGRNRDVFDLLEKIADAIEDEQGPVLSVFSSAPEPGETREATLARICHAADVPHTQVQVSSSYRLAEHGLALVHAVSDGESPLHHHVIFQVPVTESQVRTFVECFSEPEPNPTGGKRRRT